MGEVIWASCSNDHIFSCFEHQEYCAEYRIMCEPNKKGWSVCFNSGLILFFRPYWCIFSPCTHSCVPSSMCMSALLSLCLTVLVHTVLAHELANLQRCDPTGCSHCQCLLISMEPVELQSLTLLSFCQSVNWCSPHFKANLFFFFIAWLFLKILLCS